MTTSDTQRVFLDAFSLNRGRCGDNHTTISRTSGQSDTAALTHREDYRFIIAAMAACCSPTTFFAEGRS